MDYISCLSSMIVFVIVYFSYLVVGFAFLSLYVLWYIENWWILIIVIIYLVI